MSDRTYVSNRVLLCNASIDVIKDKYEAERLHEYKRIVEKVFDLYDEIDGIKRKMRGNPSIKEVDTLSSSIKNIERQIAQYDRELMRMEQEYPLCYVLQRITGNPQAERVEQKPLGKATKSNRPPKKKSIIKALNRLYDEGIFTALTYIITFLWFGYLVNVVATADSHIIGKIFFIVWSLVLAFIFVTHKFGGNDDD